MATIEDLQDSAAAGDQVSHLWILAVNAKFADHTTNLINLGNSLTALQTARDEFKVTAGTGLSVNYLGGAVRLSNGTYAVIAPGTIVVPASTISYVFVNSAGVVAVATARRLNALEMAQITTDATTVTNVVNKPIREMFNRPQKIIEATKNGTTNLNPDGISYGIPGWSATVNEGGVLNTGSGVFTLPAAWRIRVEASVNVSSPNATILSGKLSLYNASTELKILAGLSVPTPLIAPSGMVLNGIYETAEGLSIGGTGAMSLQLQFRQGTSAVIAGDANTALTVWRIG